MRTTRWIAMSLPLVLAYVSSAQAQSAETLRSGGRPGGMNGNMNGNANGNMNGNANGSCGGEDCGVPEISGAGALPALLLVAGSVAVLYSRRRRSGALVG